MKGTNLFVCAVLTASGLLSACGGGGGGDSGGGNVPTPSPLTLSSTLPADDAADVDRTVAPTLTFSVPLDSATASSIVLLTSTNETVAATVSVAGSTATVTPQTRLMPLATYTVTVGNGLRGTQGQALSGAVEVSFTTRDGMWQVEQLIETEDAGNASWPQIAMDANGNALVVWHQNDGALNNIHANRYTVGSGWGTATLIETDDTGSGAFFPQIAMDASGNALAVWRQNDGAINNIHANRYTVGSGWGTATLIETDDAGGALDPQIAVDADGNALAVWSQFDGTFTNIHANRYTVGSGWGTATLIETDDAGHAAVPQIAMDASGNALAVWRQFDGARYNIHANRYSVGSGWGTTTLIEIDDAGDAGVPQIAFDVNGNALAVWYQNNGVDFDILANRYTVGSGWGTAVLIETDDMGGAFDPQIAIDANGNALAVWYQYDGSRYNIHSNRYTADGGWETATLIETGTGSAVVPQIVLDANGNALAVWYQDDGVRYDIHSNRYTAGGGWGTAAPFETDDVGQAFSPEIAIDANGNALAVWEQSGDIFANRFQ